MQKDALFQNIFKFCTFLPKFWYNLPFFVLFCPFSEKLHTCHYFLEQALQDLLTGCQLTKKVDLFLLVTLQKTIVLLHSYSPILKGKSEKSHVSDGCPDENNTMYFKLWAITKRTFEFHVSNLFLPQVMESAMEWDRWNQRKANNLW